MPNSAASPSSWAALKEAAIAAIQADHLPMSIELPALPSVVTEFVQKSANPNVDIKVLSAIVEKDSALTVELLRYVNSAASYMRQPARSARDAILHIGVNSARSFLLAAGMRAATRAIKSRLINQRNFWNESLQRALFAREVARRLKLDAELAFVGGLLQDYLLPVLTNHFDADYIRFLEQDGREGRELADWERERFGWDHASAGALYASRWHFPDDLLCAIFYHHALPFTLEDRGPEVIKLFPVALAGLLPDQLRQTPNGFQQLIQAGVLCPALALDEVCEHVDKEQMQLAEGHEIPNQLSSLLAATRRATSAV